MNFDISPEHQALLAVAQRVGAELAPGYVARDRAGEFPPEVFRALADAHLIGLTIPVEAGGQGAGYVATGLVCEELASHDLLAASPKDQGQRGTDYYVYFNADVRQDPTFQKVADAAGYESSRFSS